jgi:hypothetical protein
MEKYWSSKRLHYWIFSAACFISMPHAFSNNTSAQAFTFIYQDPQSYEIIKTGRWNANSASFMYLYFLSSAFFASNEPILYQIANGANPLPGASYSFNNGLFSFTTPGIYQVTIAVQATTGGTVSLQQFTGDNNIDTSPGTSVVQFNCAVGSLTSTTINITIPSIGGTGIQGGFQVINTGGITCETGTYVQVTQLSAIL